MSTPTVSIEDFCIALYCGYTRPDALKPDATGRIAFTAHVVENDREDHFRAEFERVREYSDRTNSGHQLGPEDRLELSVVELEGEPGAWRVWFNPWYLHEIEFRCSRILLNGAQITGRGRHLQDELAKRSPVVPPYQAGAA